MIKNNMTDVYCDVIDNYGDIAFAIKVINTYFFEKKESHFRFFSNNRELFDIFSQNFLLGTHVEYFDFGDIKHSSPSLKIINLFERKIDYIFLESFDFEIYLENFSYFSLEGYKSTLSPGIQAFHNKVIQNKNLTIKNIAVSLLDNTGGVFPESLYYPETLTKSYFTKTYNLDFQKKFISVFCYSETLKHLEDSGFFDSFPDEYIFLSFGTQKIKSLNNQMLPFLSMHEYYSLLQLTQANIVRGENSLVTALSSNRPFYWDIYKESNTAHEQKLEDFYDYLKRTGNYGENFLQVQKECNIKHNYSGLKKIFT